MAPSSSTSAPIRWRSAPELEANGRIIDGILGLHGGAPCRPGADGRWPTQVISRLGQALPRRLVPSSNVAGESLLERLRSTSFALCGAVTAVGLGMVALVANQGWPGVFDNAIPPIPRAGVHGAQIVARPSSPNGGANSPAGRPSGASTPAATGGSGASASRPTSHQQFAVDSPGSQSPAAAPPGGHGGVGAPAGAPPPEQPAPVTPQPASGPAPVSTPAPVEQPVAEKSSPGNGKAKGHEKHSVPTGGESPPPVKEKHSHGPPPAPPATDPSPPVGTEAPAQPQSVPSGHAKGSSPGKAHGHDK
jgi:hypothetical protein